MNLKIINIIKKILEVFSIILTSKKIKKSFINVDNYTYYRFRNLITLGNNKGNYYKFIYIKINKLDLNIYIYERIKEGFTSMLKTMYKYNNLKYDGLDTDEHIIYKKISIFSRRNKVKEIVFKLSKLHDDLSSFRQ